MTLLPRLPSLLSLLLTVLVVTPYHQPLDTSPTPNGLLVPIPLGCILPPPSQLRRYIWGLGLLSSGNSSTMTGTLAGQFIMSGLLDLRVSPMLRALITRGVALGPSLAVVALVRPSLLASLVSAGACEDASRPAASGPPVRPTGCSMPRFLPSLSGLGSVTPSYLLPSQVQSPSALDTLNQGLNVLQSLQLPFALVPLLALSSNSAVVGALVSSRQAPSDSDAL